ncbi:MAG TPA: dienelactone hydrolase family protein [Hyphomicrobiales bacterium]|nr:dienelactone hydrolase family protein [Hyphomicrobiales bacterium]
MDQRIIDLYDRFTHGLMSRRDFVERLARLAGGTAAAMALLPLLRNDYARAETIGAGDPRIQASATTYPGPQDAVKAYLAHPAGSGEWPAVIVVHENRGLNPHIEDVARRLAVAGYLALAPDLLSPFGGTPADEDDARDRFAELKPPLAVAQLEAAVPVLKTQPQSSGPVGVIGFCWGGGIAERLALVSPDLAVVVAYYGPEPPLSDVKTVRAAMLLHYAGLDTRITAAGPAFAEAVKKAGAPVVERYVYPGVNHAFSNDTSNRYDKAASDLAWQRTLAFLKAHLG